MHSRYVVANCDQLSRCASGDVRRFRSCMAWYLRGCSHGPVARLTLGRCPAVGERPTGPWLQRLSAKPRGYQVFGAARDDQLLRGWA
jgi:hypothetical protein